MNEFLNFLYNHDHPNSIKIEFDKNFGSELEVNELVYKLKSRKIITSEDARNTHIVVVIDKSELYKLIREFNYNLNDYDMSKKPIINNSINVHGNVVDSIVNQGSDLGNLESRNSSIALEPAIHKAQPNDEASIIPKKLSIYEKISSHGLYKLTDHKLISTVFYAIIAIIAVVIAKYFGVFKYFIP